MYVEIQFLIGYSQEEMLHDAVPSVNCHGVWHMNRANCVQQEKATFV